MPSYAIDRPKILDALHRQGLLTYTAQAAHVGVSRQTLAGLLAGTTTAAAATVEKLHRATGLSYEDFVVTIGAAGATSATSTPMTNRTIRTNRREIAAPVVH